jgi:hypothetical protein
LSFVLNLKGSLKIVFWAGTIKEEAGDFSGAGMSFFARQGQEWQRDKLVFFLS